MMLLLHAAGLFIATAVAEIVGCYLAYLWLREQRSPLLLVPAALALAVFVWLLSLHPTGAARTYAAYGGVYIVVAILWLWLVEAQRPSNGGPRRAGEPFPGGILIPLGLCRGDLASLAATSLARPRDREPQELADGQGVLQRHLHFPQCKAHDLDGLLLAAGQHYPPWEEDARAAQRFLSFIHFSRSASFAGCCATT